MNKKPNYNKKWPKGPFWPEKLKNFEKSSFLKISYLYLKSSKNQNYFYNLKFNENDYHTRESQDEMINISILLVLNSYIDNNYDFIYLYKNYKSIFSLLGPSLTIEESNYNE